MSMRVTQGMLNTQMLRNLNENMRRMDNLQDQLATGRKINRPSDDPVGISFSMRYRSELEANEQYESNLDGAVSMMSYTDKMLEQAGDVLHRVRELAVQGANGTNSQESLNVISKEVNQLYEQMVTIGNSQYNGKYVFNGQLTDVKPYDLETAGSGQTDKGKISYEIGLGIRLDVNVTGDEVFGAPDTDTNMFTIIEELKSALTQGNTSEVSNIVGRIDQKMDKFLAIRAEIGAKTNRMQLAEGRLSDISINLQTLKSKTEDADIAAVITNLKTAENVYQASLSAGAKLIRPSLVDFLR
jgi:flagellar hook-associated protein 3 FlgL